MIAGARICELSGQPSHDYDLSGSALGKRVEELYGSMISAGQRALIVDAGAHIGASAVWFASSFPESMVVMVEPAPENCNLLKRNCACPDVTHQDRLNSTYCFFKR
jgi:predicted O-methyltransferase YrrM